MQALRPASELRRDSLVAQSSSEPRHGLDRKREVESERHARDWDSASRVRSLVASPAVEDRLADDAGSYGQARESSDG